MTDQQSRIRRLQVQNILVWLVIALSFVSINSWSRVPLGNKMTTWMIDYSLLFTCLYLIFKKWHVLLKPHYICCTFYLAWAFIGIIRGGLGVKNYWELKQLVNGSLMVSLPVFAYLFTNPLLDLKILRRWNLVMIPAFVLFFTWASGPSCYFYTLPFILLYGMFFTELPVKWKVGVAILLLLFCVDLTNRSNVLKVLSTMMVAFGFAIHRFLPRFTYKVVHWLFYITPFILIGLAASGSFNLLETMSENSEQTIEKASGEEENAGADTRTFIYYEVIESAINNGYYKYGNTPARGNESEFFVTGQYAKDEDLTGNGERFANELVHLNIFTWLGIVGIFLYSLIYLQASFLAVYRSRSIYMKFIGCTIAFHWLFGWIEDMNTFTIQNLWLWMMIAMGLSPQFRKMSDRQFRFWFKSIFAVNIRKKKKIQSV